MAFIYWDPNPQFFLIPIVNWPIFWYGIFFALGFVLGFPLYVNLLVRFFLHRPEYEDFDILDPEKISPGKSRYGIRVWLNEKMFQGALIPAKSFWQKEVMRGGYAHPERALARLALDEKFGSAVSGVRRKAIQ